MENNEVHQIPQANTQERVYPHIIEQLELQMYYPKKLTREKALTVSKNYISTVNLNDPGNIPWYILQNLIMCNYEGRCFDVCQYQSASSGMGKSFSFLDNTSHESTHDDDTTRVSPSDALIALFWCCDDFLRQLLVEKLSMCQLAVPLLLPNSPNDTSPQVTELLIWALSTLTKQWKSRCDLLCQQSMATLQLPIVSAVRLGRPLLSKSGILNSVISEQKHDFFYHYGSSGGTLKRKICGLLEMTWYLPTGKPKDVIKEPIAFMNLRGNATNLKSQTDFLSKISFATIAFMSSNNLGKEDTDLLESLYKQHGHLILVVKEKIGEALRNILRSVVAKCSKIIDKRVGTIESFEKNELDISNIIRNNLRDLLKDGKLAFILPYKSLEDCIEVAKEIGYKIDTNTREMITANSIAEEVFNGLTPEGKQKQLPLQVVAIEIGEKTKEQYLLKHKGKMQTEKYVEKVQSDITHLRNKQKNLSGEKLDRSILQLFSKSYQYTDTVRKYFYSYIKIKSDRYCINTLQPIRQDYIIKWNKFCEDLKTNKNKLTPALKTMKKKIDNIAENMSKLSLGLEHFNREIGQMYEMKSYLNLMDASTRIFPAVAAEMLLNGHSLELMDGDAYYVPLTWIEAVLTCLKDKLGDTKIFVLSVLGVQSSGKSTLLNAMFGLQFGVSAGRCTRGVFAQLVPLDISLQTDTGCNYFLVVDTEGLRSPELATIEHCNRDNELATFVIGIGDVTLINVMGQNTSEIYGILQIAVHALMKIKIVNITPSCIFVHQNNTDVATSDLSTPQKQKTKEMLDTITRLAAEEENCSEKYQSFSEVIRFQEHEHIMYVSSLCKGDPPMAPPNPGYSECILLIKKQIIKFMQNLEPKALEDFIYRLSDFWQAILSENFVFNFKDTIEIRAFNALEWIYMKHSRTLRKKAMTYIDSLQMKCKEFADNEIDNAGKSVLHQQVSKLNKDVETFKRNMEDYFSKEKKACQWKGRMEIKINELCEGIMKGLTDEFKSIRERIRGRAKIDSSIKQQEKDILKKAKILAETFLVQKVSKDKLNETFDEEWAKWINDMSKDSSQVDIESSLETIFRMSSYSRYQEEITRMLYAESSKLMNKFVTEDDLEFRSLSANEESGRAVTKSTCIVNANLITQEVKSLVSRKILSYRNEGQNYSESFGFSLFEFIKEKLSKEKIGGNVTFKDQGKHLVTMRILWSILPELKELNDVYCRKNDMIPYMEETQKDRLWNMFKDECTMMETSIKAACMISRELETAMQTSLPNMCKIGVISHFQNKKRAFANKMSLHAQLLVDLGENGKFESYRDYLQNPYQSLKSYIGEYIKQECKNDTTKEGKLVLQEIYNEQLQCLFVSTQEAINTTAEHQKEKTNCKISIWWPNLLDNISDHLDIKKNLGFFNEDCSFEVEHFTNRLIIELNESKDKIIEEFKVDDICAYLLEPCRQFFEDLLGCPELCPFCAAPCDNQAGGKYDDHRTKYHRPQGVSGYHNLKTKKLVSRVCTLSVMSSNRTFTNQDTNNKDHLYKDYKSVNKYYKAWKIEPKYSEPQLYWKWFMAKYNGELAEYYNVKKADDIPENWNQLSWESTKEDMKKTYNL